jgi:hypothetical protein
MDAISRYVVETVVNVNVRLGLPSHQLNGLEKSPGCIELRQVAHAATLSNSKNAASASEHVNLHR